MRRRLRRLFHKIREINHRYRKPRIEMSAGVRASLLALRLYLLFLISLMAYKFVTLIV